MKCLEADYIREIWMNERSIWTVIRFNKLINTTHTHTLDECINVSHSCNLIFFSDQGHIQPCFRLKLLPATP